MMGGWHGQTCLSVRNDSFIEIYIDFQINNFTVLSVVDV